MDFDYEGDEESDDEVDDTVVEEVIAEEYIEDPNLAPLDEGFFQMGLLRSVRAYGIEFKEGPKGVGAYSTVDIPFMNLPRIVMEIPVELMISVSQEHPWIFRPDFLPQRHPLFTIIESTDPEAESDLRLACMLLLGCHDSSNFWNLYSDFLPPPEDCTSLLLSSPDELAALQNTELAEQVAKEQERLRAFWEKHWNTGKVHRSVSTLCESSEKFLWAVSIVRTRSIPFFCTFGAIRQDMHLIAPYVDMMNHAEDSSCFLRWQKVEQRLQVVLKPGQSIRRGQELTLSYLPQATNEELMEKYGFSKTGNVWESIDFSGAGAKVHRDTFLSTWEIFGPFEDYRFYDESVVRTQEESGWILAAARALPTWQEGYLPALPAEEIRAARALTKACEKRLKGFPTTLDRDRKLLAKGEDKSLRWKAAMKYRMDKKDFLVTTKRALKLYNESFA